VLISVGGLTERKGFHRVLDCLPVLVKQFPGLQYLIVGAAGPEGDWGERLRRQVAELGLEDTVRFPGFVPPEKLREPLSAADVFVLATRNEGWANVFLEAMACGLPVVATDVGGNREVVCDDALGRIVPFGDHAALCAAISEALSGNWDREAIISHARRNSWDDRVSVLVEEFRRLAHGRTGVPPQMEEGRG
jgi:teichuronic acid biosynthesis glycosyltransferase TuaC